MLARSPSCCRRWSRLQAADWGINGQHRLSGTGQLYRPARSLPAAGCTAADRPGRRGHLCGASSATATTRKVTADGLQSHGGRQSSLWAAEHRNTFCYGQWSAVQILDNHRAVPREINETFPKQNHVIWTRLQLFQIKITTASDDWFEIRMYIILICCELTVWQVVRIVVRLAACSATCCEFLLWICRTARYSLQLIYNKLKRWSSSFSAHYFMTSFRSSVRIEPFRRLFITCIIIHC